MSYEETKTAGYIILLCAGGIALFLTWLKREEIKQRRADIIKAQSERISKGIMAFTILRASILKCGTRLQLDHLCDKSLQDFKYEYQDDYFKTNRDILDDLVSDKKSQLRKLQAN